MRPFGPSEHELQLAHRCRVVEAATVDSPAAESAVGDALSEYEDEVRQLRAENEKLRKLVEAARVSAQGEMDWSKFDRLLAEWDRRESHMGFNSEDGE